MSETPNIIVRLANNFLETFRTLEKPSTSHQHFYLFFPDFVIVLLERREAQVIMGFLKKFPPYQTFSN